ncbi:MAG: response regulator [Gloeobacteraceae cyanobacterium ES-bin-316]|nr:response regulator [Ferruginibacter sp.]
MELLLPNKRWITVQSSWRNRPFSWAHLFAGLKDGTQSEKSNSPAIALVGTAHNNHIKILLADDDADDRELFEEVLKDINPTIKLQPVEDGMHLMKMLQDESEPLPDLVFLDLNMPGKNGKECLQEIKKDNRLKDLPVIIYSTSCQPKDITDTHGIGAHLYICKPSSFAELIAVVKKVLSLDFKQLKSMPPMEHFVISAGIM